MNRSTKLVLFGIVLPGMASSAVYGALRHDAGPERVRLELRDVEVREGLDVDVERIVREAVEHAERAETSDGPCAVRRGETLRVDADGLERLRVVAGAGSLDVVGREGVTQVVVHSDACAATSELLEELDVSLETTGGVAEVATRYPGGGDGFGNADRYARIDLRIEVPAEMAAVIEDGSGGLRVSGVRAVDLADASGDAELVQIAANVEVQDGSGPLLLRDVGGDVLLQDGSGSVDLIGIGGDVTLEDGSGSVEISEVNGSVRLTDGSGSLDLRSIGGDVEVRADGSGSIEVADVEGDFVVLADGSGSIRMRDVRGTVDLPEKHDR